MIIDHTYINYIDLVGKNFLINCSYYKYKQQTFHIFLRMKNLSKMGHYILEVALIIFTMSQGNLVSKVSFLPIFLDNFVFSGPVSSLTGIQFGDNGSQNYLTDENGVAIATVEVFKKAFR